MLNLPDYRASGPNSNTGYVASNIWDNIRIHVVLTQDGTAVPGLFVGNQYFPFCIDFPA